jgi:hypothetical protein
MDRHAFLMLSGITAIPRDYCRKRSDSMLDCNRFETGGYHDSEVEGVVGYVILQRGKCFPTFPQRNVLPPT